MVILSSLVNSLTAVGHTYSGPTSVAKKELIPEEKTCPVNTMWTSDLQTFVVINFSKSSVMTKSKKEARVYPYSKKSYCLRSQLNQSEGKTLASMTAKVKRSLVQE